MNEKDGPMAVGIEKYRGWARTDSAMVNEIGMKMEAVAELVENSVMTTTTIERITCIPKSGREEMVELRLHAMTLERPLDLTASEMANPAPRSKMMDHGKRRRTVSHAIRGS